MNPGLLMTKKASCHVRRKYLSDGMSQSPEDVVWGTAMDHISGERPREKRTSMMLVKCWTEPFSRLIQAALYHEPIASSLA